MINPNTLKPFGKFCVTLGMIPSSYKASLTYEEQLLWFCNYLETKVIPAINNNAEALQEVQALYTNLKDFVVHYFANLDVQDEINNKLDEMAESGELQEIIDLFINSNATICFDNVNSMKLSENLVDGSFAHTFGFYDVNDGGDAFYKILSTGTADNMTIFQLNNGLYAHLIFDKNLIYAKKLGLHADKTTDDTTILQNIIDFCKTNNYELIIDGYSYITSTINTKGVKITGLGVPAKSSNTYISSIYGNLGWDYLRNTNQGALITFDNYAEDTLKTGSGIISDTANPILLCNYSDGHFNLENLCICGWLRNTLQEGLLSAYESTTSYLYGKHKLKNVSVINCGNNAIHLHSLETTNLEDLFVGYNFGYGLYIEGVNDKDTPFEYVNISNSSFVGNKLGGLYAKNSFRKGVTFDNCEFSRNGLYSQLNIDIPTQISNNIAGIKIEGHNPSTSSLQSNLKVINCYAEELQVLVNIVNNENLHVINNININNNILYPIDSDYSSLLYYDNYYCNHFSFYENRVNNGKLIELSQNVTQLIPNIVDKAYYSAFNNVNSLSFNSKLDASYEEVRRFGNLVYLRFTATANSNVNNYENLFSNFPRPIANKPVLFHIGSDNIYGTMYTNNNITVNHAIAENETIWAEVFYFVDIDYGK